MMVWWVLENFSRFGGGVHPLRESVARILHGLLEDLTDLLPVEVLQRTTLVFHPIIHHAPVGVHLQDELRESSKSRFEHGPGLNVT